MSYVQVLHIYGRPADKFEGRASQSLPQFFRIQFDDLQSLALRAVGLDV